jgi:hypothetical protein
VGKPKPSPLSWAALAAAVVWSLVSVNGSAVLVVIGVPLIVAVLEGIALVLHSVRGTLGTAWSLTAFSAAFNLVTVLSVGVLEIPVTAALKTVCSTWGEWCQAHPVLEIEGNEQ